MWRQWPAQTLFDSLRRMPATPVNAQAERDALALFDELGFREHLTPQRSNGLRSMVERIRNDARETLAQAG